MSRAAFACVAILAVLTALVMVNVARTLEPVQMASGEEGDKLPAARNFYDGLNHVLQSGDVSTLSEHVTVEARFTDGVTGSWMTLNEFGNRLGEIGKGHPQARLDITSLTVAESEAVAMVRLSGLEDQLTAGIGVDRTDGWIDRLTIRDGVVTELMGGTAGLVPSELILDDEVRHTRSLANAGLVRLTIEGGDAVPVNTPGALTALVQDGFLRVEFDNESTPMVTYARDSPIAAEERGGSPVLRPGDRFSVRESSGFVVRNESQDPASVLLIALLNPSPIDPASAPKHQTGRFSGFLVNGATGSTWQGSSGGTASMNSRLEFATSPGLQRLRIEQIALAPGAVVTQVLKSSNESQIVLLVSEGMVLIESKEDLQAGDANTMVVNADHGLVLPFEATRVQQVESGPASLIIIRLEHLEGDA